MLPREFPSVTFYFLPADMVTQIDAFQQVEDNLVALRVLQEEARQQRRAVQSAELSLQLFTNRYREGARPGGASRG